MSEAYRNAGVDIDAGNEAVERMKKHVKKTFRPEVLTGLGGFGGLFQLITKDMKSPFLYLVRMARDKVEDCICDGQA